MQVGYLFKYTLLKKLDYDSIYKQMKTIIKSMTKKTVCLGIGLFASAVGFSQLPNLKEGINTAVEKDNAEYVSIFKTLHQHPELGFQEEETADFIAEKLRSYGYRVTSGIGKTGLVGVIENGEGPVVMYRRELDALPVEEALDVPYKSTQKMTLPDGSESYVMHACGHDSHMTWMLSAADYMAAHQDLWKGTLIMLGQPAEELGDGANAMVDDGLYQKYAIPEPDYLYGMHSMPFPTGTIVAASGPRLAGTDFINVTFHGIGGHGSAPQVAKDPVVMAADAVVGYQQIVSRSADPQNPVVLTVGSIIAGTAHNIIPDKALIKINLRWFSEEDRQVLLKGIERINKGIAVANGLNQELYPTMEIESTSPVLANTKELTEIVRSGLQNNTDVRVLTEEDVKPIMGSEDFPNLVLRNEKRNYFFALVGVADPGAYKESMEATGNPPFYNHRNNYQVDLKAIAVGRKAAIAGLLTIFDHYKF